MPPENVHALYIITLPDGTERQAWDHVDASPEEVAGWVADLYRLTIADLKIRKEKQ